MNNTAPVNNSAKEILKNEKVKVHKTTFLVVTCTIISRIIGFARIGVMSAFFGATLQADILNLTLSIPNNFRKLFAEGALSNAFMPIFAKTVHKKQCGTIIATEDSKAFFASLLFWVGIPTGFFIGIASIFSRSIVRLFFNFQLPEHEILAGRVFSIVIFVLFFLTLSSIAAGIQQVHKRFFFSSIAPLVLSLAVIICIIVLTSKFTIYSAAAGYVVGSFMQTVILFATLKYPIKLSWKLPPKLTQTFINIVPIIIALIIPIAGQQIAFYIASTLSLGSSSVFSYAIVFWQLPIGVLFNSVISVGFSYVITDIAKKNCKDEKYLHQKNSVRMLLLFALPLTIVGFFFSHGAIAITLQRGEFTALDAYKTAGILRWYCLGFVPLAMYKILIKLSYAHQKIRLVFIFSAFLTTLDVILSIILTRTSLQVYGLSIAYTTSCIIVVPIYYAAFYRVLSHHLISIKEFFYVILANIPLFACSYILAYFTNDIWHKGSTLATIGIFFGIICFLALVCIIGYKMIGISMVSIIKNIKK